MLNKEIRKAYFGDWLRSQREKKSLTLNQVGQTMGLSNGQYIHNVESGRCGLASIYVRPMCRLYKIPKVVMVEKMASQYYELLNERINNSK